MSDLKPPTDCDVVAAAAGAGAVAGASADAGAGAAGARADVADGAAKVVRRSSSLRSSGRCIHTAGSTPGGADRADHVSRDGTMP